MKPVTRQALPPITLQAIHKGGWLPSAALMDSLLAGLASPKALGAVPLSRQVKLLSELGRTGWVLREAWALLLQNRAMHRLLHRKLGSDCMWSLYLPMAAIVHAKLCVMPNVLLWPLCT